MSRMERIASAVAARRRIVVACMLLSTVAIGVGIAGVEQSSSLDQFESDSTEREKLTYVEENFGAADEAETTTVQIIVHEENALSKESLLATLELQRDLRENETVNETLVDDPFGDLSNVVATTAIRQERAADLEQRRADLERDRQELNETGEQLSELLNETRELQAEYDELNASYERGEIDDETYANESERLEGEFDGIRDRARETLTDEQYEEFAPLIGETRRLQHELFVASAEYERGEIDEETRDERIAEVEAGFEETYGAIRTDVLGPSIQEIRERGEQLGEDADALEEEPTLDEQIEQLESMNQSEIDDVIETVLGEDAPPGAFAFMPTDYEPGSTTADARMLFVVQSVEESSEMEGEASNRIVDSQLAIASIVDDRFGDRAFAFGSGIITDEIDRSLVDSVAIVTPLALLFVLLTLLIAYRDLLDIVLGTFGIALVLVWTFGFTGWTGIEFNQIFIAVPVLLIGLSIDYAIHVFMRQREQRMEGEDTPQRAMAVALGGLGVALVWVTATAVIGFLSNLVSPVPPIREFGIVSAVGIVSTLLIFGLLIPAMKVSLDEFLESYGFDREKRAFGTGGGRFSRVLSIGQTAARRTPWLVIVLALLLTAGGAYGGSQVDTSFEQEDFIAEDPSDWTEELPDAIAPGNYSTKTHLEFVNQNFLREDSRTEVLIEGDVTGDATLERVDEAEELATEEDVVVVLSSGEADVRSPLSVMERVAAENETFNETYAAADTTGDGVPDENVEDVYDELFAAAPDRAAAVIYRTDDGDYEALRMTISVRGDATATEVTDATRTVAAAVDGDGLAATATGQLIVFKLIEDDLFDTVIQSLLITLSVVFLFLMVVYRLTRGSATLGAITLLPIVLSVAWILGTMYLLDIPFNVVTGTITSLTIGLGVAYNIHMSERYTLELRRGRGAWDALSRSVTGTGGALLGSAATTVGGFGVLVFAIIPMLRQFGIATGLTIVYAFLGSVLVLPSFLVVWTRYLGPDGAFEGETAERAEDERSIAVANPNGGAVLAETGGSRSVTPAATAPGGTLTVTIDLASDGDPIVVREDPIGTNPTVTAISPEPVDVVSTDGTIFVAWAFDEPTVATLEYETTIPESATGGDAIEFDTAVRTPDGAVEVRGPDHVAVIGDPYDYLASKESITVEDVEFAGEYARAGRLTGGQLEQIYSRWLGTAPDDAATADEDRDGAEGGWRWGEHADE